jgi:hypothetical protein
MTIQKRRSDRSGRAALRSPGRPPLARRENYQQFWASVAAGRSSEEAAIDAGVSPAVGGRWFRRAGGHHHAMARSLCRPKAAKLARNEALRRYVQDRLSGAVTAPDGVKIMGPKVTWKARRSGRRQHRQRAMAWSPE